MGQDNHTGGSPRERNEASGPGPEQADDGGKRSAAAGPEGAGDGAQGAGSAAAAGSAGRNAGAAPPPPASQPWGTPAVPQNPWEQQGRQWAAPGFPQPGQQDPQSRPGHPGQPGQPPSPGSRQPWGTPGYLQQGGWTPPPKPGVIPLRPLGLGELLDGAFQACRRNAAATFGTALLIQAVVSVLTFLFARGLVSPDALTGDLEAAEASMGATLTSGTLLLIVSIVGVLLLQGALVVPVARSILNLKTGFAQTWRLSRNRLLPLAGLGALLTVMLIVGILAFSFLLALVVEALGVAGIAVVILGVLALLAVAVWLVVKLALAPAALVLESTGVFASLRRSWQLTRRNFWRSFGILALTALLVSIVSSVISTPIILILSFVGAVGSSGEPGPGTAVALLAVNLAITAFFSAVGYAFQASVTSLLYVDLRIRREGFDIALMKEQELAGTTDADLVPGRNRDTGP